MTSVVEEPVDDRHSPASVLGKTGLLLEAFSGDATTLGLTELSRRSGVSKPTAHRLAGELVRLGLLARGPAGYQLGWRIYELGQLVPGPARLRRVAYPVLADLRTSVRGVVHLSMPHGRDCVYLERFAGRSEVTLARVVGTRVPSHETVSGRLLAAYAPPHHVGATRATLAAFGAANEAELDRALLTIRNQRYATESESRVPGFKSVAVPVVYGALGEAIAAISATVPVGRRDDQNIVHALWDAASQISTGLQRTASSRR